jgi:hypothetical protein
MNILKLIVLLNSIVGMKCLYTYDRINNRQITFDTSFHNVYYTSHNFHSIEYAKTGGRVISNSTNSSKTLIKYCNLRKPNSTKSLPNLHNI